MGCGRNRFPGRNTHSVYRPYVCHDRMLGLQRMLRICYVRVSSYGPQGKASAFVLWVEKTVCSTHQIQSMCFSLLTMLHVISIFLCCLLAKNGNFCFEFSSWMLSITDV